MIYLDKCKCLNIPEIFKVIPLILGGIVLFVVLIASKPPSEVCNNAIDDDGDGLIDYQDDDCICEFIELRSLIPNPSFEDRSCCPDQHYRLDCAGPWIQAYGTTPDYIHNCGWLGPDEIPPPTPFPDGDGIIGFLNGRVPDNLPVEYNWKEYAGVCLLGTMEAGKSYRIEYSLGFSSILRSPPLELTLYGTEDCDNFPFGVGTLLPGCPTNFPNWVRLEGKLMEADETGRGWVNDFFEFTPDINVNAIAIGPPCELFEGNIGEYYFLDNLIMEETFLFQFQINASGDACDESLTLSVESFATLEYQWFKDSIALVGETSPELLVAYGTGNYQVRMIQEDGCRMSPPYFFEEPEISMTRVNATICEGDTYEDGDFSTSEIGNYRYTIPASSGCDSIINLRLSYCKFYLPNVFSPNGDGVNDIFKVDGEAAQSDHSILIFDRWGNQVFEGKEWDGYSNGEISPDGVYVYFVKLHTSTGDQILHQGSITLLR